VRSGDELLGLTRALLCAGASSVLSTMWSVDDEATAELMSAFYDHWIVRHECKVDALLAAQRHVIGAGYRDPALWAPCALIGDWY